MLLTSTHPVLFSVELAHHLITFLFSFQGLGFLWCIVMSACLMKMYPKNCICTRINNITLNPLYTGCGFIQT